MGDVPPERLVSRLAEEATLTPTAIPASTLLGVYDQYKQFFFTQVCTIEVHAFGSRAASLAAAGPQRIAGLLRPGLRLETQSSAFQSAVLALPVGKVAPSIPTSYGYLVVKVASRAVQPFSPGLERVLSTALASSQGGPNTVLEGLLAKARIQINPAYGAEVAPGRAAGL